MSRNFRVGFAIFVLVVFIPAWLVISVSLMEWAEARFGPLNFWVQMAAWVTLGLVWIFPFKRAFIGVAAKGSAPRRFTDDPPEAGR